MLLQTEPSDKYPCNSFVFGYKSASNEIKNCFTEKILITEEEHRLLSHTGDPEEVVPATIDTYNSNGTYISIVKHGETELKIISDNCIARGQLKVLKKYGIYLHNCEVHLKVSDKHKNEVDYIILPQDLLSNFEPIKETKLAISEFDDLSGVKKYLISCGFQAHELSEITQPATGIEVRLGYYRLAYEIHSSKKIGIPQTVLGKTPSELRIEAQLENRQITNLETQRVLDERERQAQKLDIQLGLPVGTLKFK